MPMPGEFHIPEQFTVYIFFPDGTHNHEGRFADARAAIHRARSFITRPAAKLGMIPRIIVTDAGDSTIFEWKHREGITHPLTDVTRDWNTRYLKSLEPLEDTE